MKFGDAEGFLAFAAVEFVGFGEEDHEVEAVLDAGANDFKQGFVEFSEAEAGVAEHDDGAEVVAFDEVVGHDLLPAAFGRLRHGGVAVAG